MNPNDVPMMFRAQIKGRGHLQYVPSQESSDKQHCAYKWVKEWTQNYSALNDQPSSTDLPIWKQSPPRLPKHAEKPPKFLESPTQQKKSYHLDWRLMTNCGQDDTIIRPIIGANGYPFFPGSSMKGAFRRAWKHLYGEDKLEDYCGTAAGTTEPKPGCLRFHGGYPTDMSWIHDLVDVINPQEKWQVEGEGKVSAYAAISLKKVTFEFSISSKIELQKPYTWTEIWKVWEQALAEGLGSRTSAGYGHFFKENSRVTSSNHELASIKINGYGLYAKLFNSSNSNRKFQKNEFRPNMFKAALRGHTLRFLGGLTSTKQATYLTKLLWGGTGGDPISSDFDTRTSPDSAIVGLFGVDFQGQPTGEADRYKIENGCLTIRLNRHDLNLTDTQKNDLQNLAEKLLHFSVVFAGFGKSWRRVDHQKFYKVFDGSYRKQIGCHFWFADGNEEDYHAVKDAGDLNTLITNVRSSFQTFAQAQVGNLDQNIAQNWREAWHPYQSNLGGVQVWTHLRDAESLAIQWFHKPYQGSQSIKNNKILTGYVPGQGDPRGEKPVVGRVWHRMYPVDLDHKKYIEILTIFPDESPDTQKFLQFLADSSDFQCIYGA
jgi:CRISPR-associated protein Cmr6